MPSTYTVNLGIEKPATGEQSGTWGDTTNINFDLLDQAINGCLSLTLASAGTSGSPNTLAISDGATSDGRNKWIEFVDGGDLGATAYVQLTPNDAEKIVFIRNSLSGSRSVILFQGTYDAGRDLEVPAGVDMVVKFSGGGATATTTDIFTKLRATEITTPTLTTDDLTAGTADINDGTVEAVIGGTTPKAGTFTNLTANTDLSLATGATVTGINTTTNMSDASATTLATSLSIKTYVDDQVATVDTLAEVLANGNTSGANNLIIDSGQALTANTINETTAGSGVTIDSVLLKDDGVNATNLEITNIKANDGTAAGSIANSTGAVTITSFISNSVDIGGGAIDGTAIGGSTANSGAFTTLTASSNVSFDGGTIKLDGNYPVGSHNVALGDGALAGASLTGSNNVAIGSSPLASNTSGAHNIAVGRNVLDANTTGGNNIGIGHASLTSNISGENNIAIGRDALANTTASNNTAVGYQAGYANTTGEVTAFGNAAGYSNTTGSITAIGQVALYTNTTGVANVAVGTSALLSNTTASENTAVGYQALTSNTTGTPNAAFGYRSQYLNTTGNYNSSFGAASLRTNTTGANNVSVGYAAMYSNATASNNTAVGYQALYNNTTGAENVAVGRSAMFDTTTGPYNTALGRSALASNTTAAYSTVVGYQAGYTGNGNYQTILGANAGFTGTTAQSNTLIGYGAGYSLTTGNHNTFVGARSSSGNFCGQSITTGSMNTILGGYTGNQGGLSIITASNYIVLSDGAGTPYMHFTDSGRATIGNPNEGSGGYSGILTLRYLGGGSEYGIQFLPDGDNAHACSFFNSAGTAIGNITLGTSGTTYNTSSDYRLKENVVDLTGAADRVQQLAPKRFNFIAEADKTVDGFLAHEVADIVPEAISGEKDAVDEDGNIRPQSIDQSKLVPLLTAALQEALTKIDALEARIAALES